MAEGALTELLARRGWTGKPGQALPMLLPGKGRPRLIVAVGMGPKGDITLERCREAAAYAVKQVSRLALKSLALPLDDFTGPGRPAAAAAGALVEGAMLAGYAFRRYKSGPQDEGAGIEELLLTSASEGAGVRASLGRARAVCEATMLARDLGNTPANEMTPTRLAEAAREMCARSKVRFKKLGRPEMEKLGMNALLAVSRGSAEPPVLLEMEVGGKGPRPKTLVLVGKGITFDSGGLSLKPAENMDKMKYDMSGAAAVIAVMKALAAVGTRHRVIGLVPACENLPGGTATRPGDIVRAMNGRTIEILNTDAEGRLILADALCYAARFKPAAIVDVATLTGAAIIALGDQCSAVLGSNQPLIDELVRAGERSGERLWQLPLWKAHLDEIRGETADIKNTGGRPAGTIKGAAFLRHFVGDTPWAHIDIAATANVEKEKPLAPLGGTGVGVRLLTAFVEGWR
jgi:leucyl aminopeptidase